MIKEQSIDMTRKAYDCLASILDGFDSESYYTPKNFENGFDTRSILDTALSDKAAADKEAINNAVASGQARSEAVAPYETEEAFEKWYESFVEALHDAADAEH